MIKFVHKGNLKKSERYLEKLKKSKNLFHSLEKFAQEGVNALGQATPRDTGKTASSWSYQIEINQNGCSIYWKNTNTDNGEHVAILIQYGHSNGRGGYVEGVDYINPALTPIFEKISEQVWKEVTRA